MSSKYPFRKAPEIAVPTEGVVAWRGRSSIVAELRRAIAKRNTLQTIVAVECYSGVQAEELLELLRTACEPAHTFLTREAMLDPTAIQALTQRDVTDDPVFGHLTSLQLEDFFNSARLEGAKARIADVQLGVVLVYGPGASFFASPDLLVYADMPRWEHQLRFRRSEADNLGLGNRSEPAPLQCIRAFFVDWRLLDRHKKRQINRWDYVLDSTLPGDPKLVTGAAYRDALRRLTTRPFSVKPFFDPGPWGGEWMRSRCELDEGPPNYAWCFNCVPEENSLLLRFGDTTIETPAVNLVFAEPRGLLGEAVHARFGDEFPIRFDFLDTMQGSNLSLQVHPLTEYIQEKFGLHYTQDESYYLMDVAPGAQVYLGLKSSVEPSQMIRDLQIAQSGERSFPAERHVATWPARTHDHFLIPAGTVHCSGANCMVLEISATPYIFTFKMWDWDRLGLDGRPRPIHLEHAAANIQWDRREPWVEQNLINRVETVARGDGWREERTGLHEREFIETRCHWFTGPTPHDTAGKVHVLCLVQGEAAVVESPTERFEPFLVHCAEVFVVPAGAGQYTIRPLNNHGVECATIKAYVRTNC